jgi:hypothetical protein
VMCQHDLKTLCSLTLLVDGVEICVCTNCSDFASERTWHVRVGFVRKNPNMYGSTFNSFLKCKASKLSPKSTSSKFDQIYR